MKKSLISVVAASLLLCGCGDINKTYETYEIVKKGVDMTTIEITASRTGWHDSKEGEGNPGFYVYQQFDFPEITPEIFNNGSVLVYMIETNQDYTCKHVLPYVYPRDVIDNGNRFQIMQNIRYEVEPGLLTIAVEWQDFFKCPLDEDFKFDVCILSPGK
jgi:hypothetical protein